MTSKLTREENVQAVFDLKAGYTLGLADVEILKRVARMALAAMDSEPVAWTDEEELRDVERGSCGYLFTVNPVTPHADERRIILLYRHAQPAQVVPDDIKLRELFDSWFASDCSFDRSPEASEEDNIAWRESYWYVWQRCRAAMLQELQKSAGEPNNCRSSENVQVVQDVSRCSTKAAPVLDSSPKTAESRCSKSPMWIGVDWAKGFEPGNSPVIPDGYVMVPKEPTEEMNKAGWAAMNEHDAINPTYRAMLAAAPAGIPMNSTKWIPVSERMPETDGNYWGWWSESKRQGPVWFIKSELQAQFQSHEITHWMPLPAAPQEVKGE